MLTLYFYPNNSEGIEHRNHSSLPPSGIAFVYFLIATPFRDGYLYLATSWQVLRIVIRILRIKNPKGIKPE